MATSPVEPHNHVLKHGPDSFHPNYHLTHNSLQNYEFKYCMSAFEKRQSNDRDREKQSCIQLTNKSISHQEGSSVGRLQL